MRKLVPLSRLLKKCHAGQRQQIGDQAGLSKGASITATHSELRELVRKRRERMGKESPKDNRQAGTRRGMTTEEKASLRLAMKAHWVKRKKEARQNGDADALKTESV